MVMCFKRSYLRVAGDFVTCLLLKKKTWAGKRVQEVCCYSIPHFGRAFGMYEVEDVL